MIQLDLPQEVLLQMYNYIVFLKYIITKTSQNFFYEWRE
jgi:hypothetical protein